MWTPARVTSTTFLWRVGWSGIFERNETAQFLTKDELKAVMARRDKIVAVLQKLISERGEQEGKRLTNTPVHEDLSVLR